MNCCVVPRAIVEVWELTAIDKSALGVIVNVVDALTEPRFIAMVVLPAVIAFAIPCVPAALLMFAMPPAVELHWPALVRFCVVPSL